MSHVFAFALLLSATFCPFAMAQDSSPQGQAQWLLERLTGVKWPADSTQVNQVAQKISAGDKAGAADIALSQPQFLNVTVKQFALQMSTREENLQVPFNDFTAAFMGVTRDNTDARELLYGNFYYKADPAKVTLNAMDLGNDILMSNRHYQELAGRRDVDVGASLIRVEGQMLVAAQGDQGVITSMVPNPDPAGVLTSRAFLAAHATAGTNRRLVEYTFREFECIKMPEWSDTSAPDVRIGRDISRAPGGDPTKFQTSCKGCHTQMDGFRGAFARWDYNGSANDGFPGYAGVTQRVDSGVDTDPTTGSKVVRKMNRPNFIEYAGGFVTKDDSWINNARGTANAMRFGWSGDSTGKGVNSFGRLIANSNRFPQCMAKRVWASVCKYDLPADQADAMFVSLGLNWATSGYKFKDLFKAVATHAKCRQQ